MKYIPSEINSDNSVSGFFKKLSYHSRVGRT
nr:MAG TPA: hypothetical protein [Bacteriophage sp.]